MIIQIYYHLFTLFMHEGMMPLEWGHYMPFGRRELIMTWPKVIFSEAQNFESDVWPGA